MAQANPKKERKVWDFDEELSGSFAEQRWEWFKLNPEGFRARYGEKVYADYMKADKLATDEGEEE